MDPHIYIEIRLSGVLRRSLKITGMLDTGYTRAILLSKKNVGRIGPLMKITRPSLELQTAKGAASVEQYVIEIKGFPGVDSSLVTVDVIDGFSDDYCLVGMSLLKNVCIALTSNRGVVWHEPASTCQRTCRTTIPPMAVCCVSGDKETEL